MIKKKDHALLEEAYAKVMLSEITSELPEDPENNNKEDTSKIDSLIAAMNEAHGAGDMDSLKRTIAELNVVLHIDSGMPDDDYEFEEPQSSGGTGQYISNKQKSKEAQNDFLINRMNLKPGKDFPKN
jgi:hypothetical protein